MPTLQMGILERTLASQKAAASITENIFLLGLQDLSPNKQLSGLG